MSLSTIPLKKRRRTSLIDMSHVTAIILGGGEGKRLFPLTSFRCKPAITFGGRYRLIDVPVSNAINSGIFKIFVLTQFLSSSIHRHISETYHLNEFTSGFLDILPAEQKPGKKEWFQGTADAVRQHLESFASVPSDYYLILAGDQLYHLDFRKMVLEAERTGKDVVVATLPIPMSEAHRMGVMKVNEEGHITDFVEKPKDAALLEQFLQRSKGDVPKCLASMGIYLFRRKALLSLLKKEKGDDFGMHLIPHMVKEGRAAAYIHEGYWEDIGTIDSFYRANLDLIDQKKGFDLHEENSPIFSSRMHLPGAQFDNAEISRSIVCEGSILRRCQVEDSVLGPRTFVGEGCIIKKSYLLGNDNYSGVDEEGEPVQFEIGPDAVIERAIVDKNVRIGKGVKLINEQRLQEYDSPELYVREGIIVVTKGAHLPDHFRF